MRCLLIDIEGMALDLALRAIADGHEVRLCQTSVHPIGRGFDGLTLVKDWRASMSWVGRDGLVVTTGNSKFLTELDRYRDMGFRIFGPTVQSARLEIDRNAGMEAMKSVGISIPHYEQFDSLKDAEVFARKSDKAYVFKPLGSEEDKALTFVASSPAEMVGWLQRQQKRGLSLKGPCMLQEKIDMICEIGVSGWFGPAGFLENKWQVCFEHKKTGNDDTGPNCGEAGTVCQYVKEDEIAKDVLESMAPVLQALGHRGDFAVGGGVDTDGQYWPFEWTARAGWPARFIQDASHKGDCIQWMSDLMDGEDTLHVDYRPAVGVVMAQPPFPQWNGKPECVDGNPISGMEDVWGQVHPAMMQVGRGPYMDGGRVKDGPIYQTAGELVCVVTGLGSTVAKARDAAYDAVREIKFSDVVYRTDIGKKLETELPKLHKFGYAEAISY